MKKEMLINCLQSEEIRIAIIENGVLEELYVERASHESYVGNIYKGRVVNIEPSIQAAFVDFGVGRNGFLHVSDVEPAYFRHIEQSHGGRDRGRGGRGRDRDRGDRGARGDRGGRHQPRYDEYDSPPRQYRQPATEPGVEEEVIYEPSDVPEPQAHELPHAEPPIEGPDIIVEEIYDEEDEFYQPPAQELTEPTALADDAIAPPPAAPESHEPTGLSEDWPAPMESREEPAAEAPPAPTEPPEEAPTESAEEADAPDEPAAPENNGGEEEEAAEEEKPKRKGTRRSTKGKGSSKARKPRKRAGGDEPPAGEDPKPRPMDSSERRTGADDPSLDPIEPRPMSKEDLTDDDLSFSKAPPPPAPKQAEPDADDLMEESVVEPEPDEELIVEEEEFVESSDLSGEIEDVEAGPMEPAIPKVEPEESFEDLVEEEKSLEEEDEIVVSEIGGEEAEEAHFDRGEEFHEREEFAPRERGDRGDRGRGGRGRGDRGDRGGRGGRDRGGRGGRDRARGGRDGGRDRGRGGRPGLMRPRPHIEDIFKRGQEVLVQVIKEGIGTKGPTLSTYISIAGRYLVLMPGLNRIGVSRKIDDEETRRRLREIMNELKPPRGIGFIIRTAGQDRDSKELQSDLSYLSRLWQVVVRRIKKQKSPCEIYKESDMVTRTIRDIFTSDIDTIWVDERGAYEAAKEFMEAVMPRYADRIKFYDGSVPMFHKYGIENEIARIQERKVPLPLGGSIVIDQAEALVAIDVNSGNFRADNNNAEETAYQMNLHAAKEIARQLRLRDLGGVIVNDFIDMREDRHRRGVEKALRDAVQRDRARTKILRISQFGLIEMTRQRIRPSLKRSAFAECTHCKGTGHVKTCESVAIEVIRMLQLAINREHIARIDVRVHEEAAQYLLNRKRKEIVSLEEPSGKQVSIASAGAAVSPEFLEFMCYDNNGNEVKFTMADEPPPRPPQRRRGGH